MNSIFIIYNRINKSTVHFLIFPIPFKLIMNERNRGYEEDPIRTFGGTKFPKIDMYNNNKKVHSFIKG